MSTLPRILHHIGGQAVAPAEGQYLPVENPATGKPYADVAAGTAADVDAAFAAAEQAFPAWRDTLPADRAAQLFRLADALEARLDEFARAETEDTGKPLTLARRVDIPRAVRNLRFFAAAADQFASESHAMGRRAVNYTLRQPLGVVGCISPWNLPLYLFTWKIAPALAAGNCVLAKPSELTPATAGLLGEVLRESAFPPGVLNILQGEGPAVGQAIVEHPGVKAVSFTGGTATGAHIAQLVAPQFKKLSLELGGKNPTLIFADADLDQAIPAAARAAFTNQGEICLCGSRLLVERTVYDRVRAALIERTNALRVGDPLDEDTDLGALISHDHLEKVRGYLRLAREEGGTILTGGEVVAVGGRCSGGHFLQPALVEGLDAQCRTNQEEIFGPVLTMMPFDGEAEALAMANSTRYGLAASVWTRDLTRAHRVGARLESGIVWVNCWMQRDLRTPFGGMKASGLGREGGWEAMRFFTEPQNICVDLGGDE